MAVVESPLSVPGAPIPTGPDRVYMWVTFDPTRRARWYFRPMGSTPALRFWEVFNYIRKRPDVALHADAGTVSGNDKDMTLFAKWLRSTGAAELIDKE